MSTTYYTIFHPDESLPGAKGSAAFSTGTPILQLTTYNISVPSNWEGDVVDLTNANSTAKVMQGETDVTADWVVTATPSAGITGTFVANKYTITGFTQNSGTVTFKANKSGSPELEAIFNISKVRSGIEGSSTFGVVLSKPFMNILTDDDGDNPILTGSGTFIHVYEGADLLEYDGIGTSPGTWRISSRDVTNVTAGTIAPDTAEYAIVNDLIGMNPSEDQGSITYNISGKSLNGQAFTDIKGTQNFSKLKGLVADFTPPGTPTGLTVTSEIIVLEGGNTMAKLKAVWTSPGDSDLSYYDVEAREGTGGFIGYQTSSTSYEWIVKNNTSYGVRVRAIDKSGNVGSYSSIVSHVTGKDTTPPAIPTTLTAVAAVKNVFLNWTNPSDPDVASIQIFVSTTNTIPGTPTATVNATPNSKGGFTHSGLNTGTTYYYWLKAVDTSGNVSAATASTNASPGQIAGPDIVAGAVTADKVLAGSLTGDRFSTTTSLPGTITVGTTGVTIQTVQSNAALGAQDPATRINSNATLIDPGRIQIYGSTTLSSWKNGTNSTEINGGAIAANTIAANKVTVGSRAVDIEGIQFQAIKATNTLYWTGGYISIPRNADGILTSYATGASQTTWSSGVLWVYWINGSSALNVTTSRATAYSPDNIVLATYRGQADLVVHYGRTIIDGDQITTGTIQADRLRADTTLTNRLYIGAFNNFFLHGSYYGASRGSMIVMNAGIERVKIGYTSESNIGIEIRDASNNIILSSSSRAEDINNSFNQPLKLWLSSATAGGTTISGPGYFNTYDGYSSASLSFKLAAGTSGWFGLGMNVGVGTTSQASAIFQWEVSGSTASAIEYRNGVKTILTSVSWNTATVLTVTFDGTFYRFYVNGSIYTYAISTNGYNGLASTARAMGYIASGQLLNVDFSGSNGIVGVFAGGTSTSQRGNISGTINASNVSTYIANAAIQNAQIGNLQVDNAKIANLTVGTEKITANAVTIPYEITTSDKLLNGSSSGAGPITTLLTSGTVALGPSGGACIYLFGYIDGINFNDTGGKFDLYTSINGGAMTLASTIYAGIITSKGNSYYYMPILLSDTVTGVTSIAAELRGQSLALRGSSASRPFYLRGIKLWILGVKR